MLEQDPEIHVVGSAADGQEAFALALEKRPEIILMDLDLPKMDGIQTTRLILGRYPKAKILMLSVYGDDEHIRMGLEAGAAGYILKDADQHEFIRIIKHYAKGLPITSAFLTPYQSIKPGACPLDFSALTKREAEIMDLLALGLSNKEMSDRLCISIETVKVHLQHIYRKVGVKSRVELILCLKSHQSQPSQNRIP
jgi:NarL family two-component system response regulator LiaR